ncbi:hypothetical protein, partial [Sinorhizobium medicae]|uniref:hypothetical protein n=1 Tax=Sinorhizobium medicae TaxID=110321 RepID=UPI001AECAE5E
SSGLGRRPFTAETRVRFPLGVPFFPEFYLSILVLARGLQVLCWIIAIGRNDLHGLSQKNQNYRFSSLA